MSYHAHDAYVARTMKRQAENEARAEAVARAKALVHYDCFGTPASSKGDADYITAMVGLFRAKKAMECQSLKERLGKASNPRSRYD